MILKEDRARAGAMETGLGSSMGADGEGAKTPELFLGRREESERGRKGWPTGRTEKKAGISEIDRGGQSALDSRRVISEPNGDKIN